MSTSSQSTNRIAQIFYFVVVIAATVSFYAFSRISKQYEEESQISFHQIINYKSTLLRTAYLTDWKYEYFLSILENPTIPITPNKFTVVYTYSFQDSNLVILNSTDSLIFKQEEVINLLYNSEIFANTDSSTQIHKVVEIENKSHLAFYLQSFDSLSSNRRGVLAVLTPRLDSLLAVESGSGIYSMSLIMKDTLHIIQPSVPCLNNEIYYASLSTNDTRHFSCKINQSQENFCLIKSKIIDSLFMIIVFNEAKPKLSNNLLFLFSILILLIGTILLPIIYRNQLQKHIRKINEVVNRISEKDFNAMLTNEYRGELGILADSINVMRVQLKEVYENLEIRVIRRTSEISMRNAELRKTQRDILTQNHELKSAYEALKESREKYEKLIEHLEDEYFFYSKAVDGGLLFVSTSVKKILGYEKKDYRQIHDQIYTESPLNKIAREREENLRNAISQPKFQKVVFNIDKQEKILEVSEVPVFNEEGQLVSIEGLAHDITEQQKAEEIIKEQEEKYRMLFTYASDFIIMFEINREKKKIGNFIEANHYTLERLGYTIDELRNMSPLNILATEIWEDKDELPEEFATTEDTFERIWESKSGNILDVEISAHAFKIKNKTVVIAVARDITDRKRSEEEIQFINEELINQKENLEALVDNLTQTQEQLVQSEKMAALGQLIAGIAHEINTPLGAIKASIGNLSDSLDTALGELPELFQTQSVESLMLFSNIFEQARQKKPDLSSREKRQMRREIASNFKEAEIADSDLLADALVYLEIYPEPAQKLLPSLQTEDALKVVRSARNFISLLKNTNTINIAVEKATKVVFALKKYAHRDAVGEKVSTDIIDNIETVLTLYNNQLKQGVEVIREYDKMPLVACYQDELSQVWTNLIHNSIQAMRQEGTITITAHHKGEFIYLIFKDTGPGIEPDIIEKIFEPFFTTKKQGEGSGLGLDIVKKIIDKHNGIISVESKLGDGAKFTIKLPVE